MSALFDAAAAVAQIRRDGLPTYLQALYADADPTQIYTALDAVSRHAYWQEKDLPLSVQVMEAGWQWFGTETGASDSADIETSLSRAKAFAYNIGSYCWPGWDEDGITPTEEQVLTGEEYAHRNLSLADRLDKPALAKARAHWLVGAYAIVRGDYPAAMAEMAHSERLAEEGGSEAEILLAVGYAEMIAGLANGLPSPALTAATRLSLLALENGAALVDQIERAERHFRFVGVP